MGFKLWQSVRMKLCVLFTLHYSLGCLVICWICGWSRWGQCGGLVINVLMVLVEVVSMLKEIESQMLLDPWSQLSQENDFETFKHQRILFACLLKYFYYPKLLQKSNRTRIPRHFPCSLRVTQSLTIRVLIYSFRQWLNSSNCPKMLRSTSGSPLASPKLISNSIQVLFFHWIIFKF